MTSIVIYGCGVVGSCIRAGFESSVDVFVQDMKYGYSVSDSTVKDASFIFICVPTPSYKESGKTDCRIFMSVVNDIKRCGNSGFVVVKSAVPPSYIKEAKDILDCCTLCVSPEYLVESRSWLSYIDGDLFLLGCDYEHDALQVFNLYKNHSICRYKNYKHVGLLEAAFMKYMENSFLAMKVIFANEMFGILKAMDICCEDGWDKIIEAFMCDKRMGTSHMQVPGPDGDFGFGGKCFPKDVRSLISFAEDAGADVSLMKAVWEKNLTLRSDKDWEKIEGAETSEGN